MTDIASIGVKFDTSDVQRGVRTLEQVAQAGPRVEKAMAGVERTSGRATKVLRTLGDGAGKGLTSLTQIAPKVETGLGRIAQTADRAKQSIAEMMRMAASTGSVLQTQNAAKGFTAIERGADSAASAVGRLNTVLALAGAGVSVQSIIGWSDGYTKLTAQLRNATDTAQDYALAMASVKRISTDAQAGIGELGVLYARIASSTKELGLSQERIAQITETVALSLKANGAGAAEAASAMLQLSQAFGSGVLRGEEFNAVYEAAPNLLRNLAEAMGVPAGKLREMASEGMLTAEVLAKHLPESLEKVRKEAESMATIGGAFTVLNNEIMQFVGAGGQASGVSKTIAQGIAGLANNLDTVATAAGAVALVLTGRYVSAMTASAAASASATAATVAHQVAMVRAGAAIAGYSTTATAGLVAMTGAARAASLAMGALGGPVGLAITALGLGAAAFYTLGDSANDAKSKIASLHDPLDELTAKLAALPTEQRIAITLDLKDEHKRAVEDADAAVNALIQSVGDLTNMRLPADEWNALRDRVEAAAKSGQDLTPILTAAANAASIPDSFLNKWLVLAGNLRAVQKEAAEAANKLASIAGMGAGAALRDREAGNTRGSRVNYAALRSSHEWLATRNDGISKSFISDIEGLAKAYASGALSAKEYAAAVNAANQRRHESTEAGKAEQKALRESEKGAKSGANAYQALADKAAEYVHSLQIQAQQSSKLTQSQKLQIELDSLLAKGKGKVSAATVAQIQASIAIAKAMEGEALAVKRAQESYQDYLQDQEDWAKYQRELEDATNAMRIAVVEQNIELDDQMRLLELEASLMGASSAAREIAIEQLRVQIELEKELRDISNNTKLDAAGKQEAEAAARARAVKKIAIAERKVYVSEWEKTSQLIGDTLADYIMSGGKDAATYLKRLFATLVLQPVVNYGVQSALGAVGLGGSAQAGGLGGVLSGAQNVQSLYSAFSGGLTTSVATGIGSIGAKLGSSLMSNFAAGMVGGAQMAAPVGMGIGSVGSASMTGAMSAGAGFATALPWVAGGLALLSMFGGSFSSRGANHVGGAYSSEGLSDKEIMVALGFKASSNKAQDITKRSNADLDKSVAGLASGLLGAYNSLASVIGGNQAQINAAFAVNPKYKDEKSYGYFQLRDEIGNLLVDYDNRKLSKDHDAAWEQYANDMAGAFVGQLRSADIAGWADDILTALGDEVTVEGFAAAAQQIAVVDAAFKSRAQTLTGFDGLSADLQTTLVRVSGGFDALSGNLTAWYAGFYSEQEQYENSLRMMRDALAGLDLSIDPAMGDRAKEEYRRVAEDALKAGNAELYAQMISLGGSFAQLANYAQKASMDISLTVSDATRALAEARAQAISGAWGSYGSMASMAAQYTGNGAGLRGQLATVRESYAGATDTATKVAALQQIISLEEGLFNLEQQRKQKQVQAAQEQLASVQRLLTASQRLSEYAKGLFTGSQSGLSDTDRMQALGSEYQSLLAKAKTGDADAMSKLQGVSSEYLRLAELSAVSQADYSVTAGVMASELASVAAIQEASAKAQEARLERQIAAAEAEFSVSLGTQKLIDELLVESQLAFEAELANTAQLIADGQIANSLLEGLPTELGGVLNTTLVPAINGIADAARAAAAAAQSSAAMASSAIAAAQASSWLHGSHAGGLSYVPFDGYRAELHKGERVLTAAENRAYTQPMLQQSSNAEVVAELRALRQEHAKVVAELAEIKKSTGQFADQFDNVSAGGNAMATEVMNGGSDIDLLGIYEDAKA